MRKSPVCASNRLRCVLCAGPITDDGQCGPIAVQVAIVATLAFIALDVLTVAAGVLWWVL